MMVMMTRRETFSRGVLKKLSTFGQKLKSYRKKVRFFGKLMYFKTTAFQLLSLKKELQLTPQLSFTRSRFSEMLPRSRRRSHFSAYICAFSAALLLLFSVALLHSRLTSSPPNQSSLDSTSSNPLLDDTDTGTAAFSLSQRDEDRIDEHDVIEDGNLDRPEVDDEDDSRTKTTSGNGNKKVYYYDNRVGVIRRNYNKRSIEDWDDYGGFDLGVYDTNDEKEKQRIKGVFGSDDVAVDEEVRDKVEKVKTVEEALLLKKGSSLRDGWGAWFDAKSDFLRRDKMFKSNLELLNPLNNPLLQDPDAIGVTGLTRGDKMVQKEFLNQFKKIPFGLNKKLLSKDNNERKTLGDSGSNADVDLNGKKLLSSTVKLIHNEDNNVRAGKNVKMVEKIGSESVSLEHRTADDSGSHSYDDSSTKKLSTVISKRNGLASDVSEVDGNEEKKRKDEKMVTEDARREQGSLNDADSNGEHWHIKKAGEDLSGNEGLTNDRSENEESDDNIGSERLKGAKSSTKYRSEFLDHVYADGKRWGYFPGLHPHLSFLNFMDEFFRKGKCSFRIFMVWNSPPWMYGVRQRRGLESALLHHPDACIMVFSETIELDFFKDVAKEGFKVAVVMPDLDELLKETPAHVFASVWFEWKKTSFYSTHYSELVRLAALYKYGGLYLDSDMIVLKPLTSLNNSVGLEDHLAGSQLNGAVMAFRKHSPFIMACLTEYYSTYDDTRLRWNGAELVSRVAKKFQTEKRFTNKKLELKVQPSFMFFPVSSLDIKRYFTAPATELVKAEEDALFKRILNESATFHFWNSITSALVPEPGSLVSRLIGHFCIRCSDVL